MSKWDERMIVKAYELAKDGLSDDEIAAACRVGSKTFWRYKKEHAGLKYALARARKKAKPGKETFSEFVYRNLPDDLKRLWEEIEAIDETSGSVDAIRAYLSGKGDDAKKHLFLYALTESHFSVSEACRKMAIPMRTYRKWIFDDPSFEELVGEIEEHKKNFCESALMDLVARRDSGAVLFANKSINGDRGYNDKHVHEVTGTITHNHAVVAIDNLDLPIETRREILTALREAKKTELPLHIETSAVGSR